MVAIQPNTNAASVTKARYAEICGAANSGRCRPSGRLDPLKAGPRAESPPHQPNSSRITNTPAAKVASSSFCGALTWYPNESTGQLNATVRTNVGVSQKHA